MSETILVCGGAGYIGSHMVRLLQECGFEPIVFDNLSTGHREAVDGVQLVEGDIRDKAALDSVFAANRIDAVMHFCARSLVGESVAHPLKYYDNNVNGSISLLGAMQRHAVEKLVFSSSAAVFGNPRAALIDESHPTRPVNPYGRSKLMVEQVLSDAVAATGLRAISLRYFNAAGASMEGGIGESHEPETHLVPNMLKTAMDGSSPLKIFGDDYDTHDGTCVRDYIHVDDLAHAHLAALTFLTQEDGFHTFNLGNARGFSVLEVIRTAERVVGKSIPFDVVARRPGDPAVLVASNALAAQKLTWRPEITDLETIIRSAWCWHDQQRF